MYSLNQSVGVDHRKSDIDHSWMNRDMKRVVQKITGLAVSILKCSYSKISDCLAGNWY